MRESTNFNEKRNKGGKPTTKMRQKGTTNIICYDYYWCNIRILSSNISAH